jgi:Tfp pilus assembly protein PilZ
MTTEHKERRKHRRYLVSGLRIRLMEKKLFGLLNKPAAREYLCLDVSEGGIQFTTQDKFAPNNPIIFVITTPSTKNSPIKASARVVWVAPADSSGFSKVGIEFVSLEEAEFSALKNLIQKVGTDKSKITPYIAKKLMSEDSIYLRIKK